VTTEGISIASTGKKTAGGIEAAKDVTLLRMSIHVPCPSCGRHVRNDAAACPFCATALGSVTAPRVSFVGLMLGLTLAGCAAGPQGGSSDDGSSSGETLDSSSEGKTATSSGESTRAESESEDYGGQDYAGPGSEEDDETASPSTSTGSTSSGETGSTSAEDDDEEYGGQDYAGPGYYDETSVQDGSGGAEGTETGSAETEMVAPDPSSSSGETEASGGSDSTSETES